MKEHWLIVFARTADLQVDVVWDAEMSINSMLIGALRELLSLQLITPRVSDFRRLIRAHEDAEQILKQRRAATAANAAVQPSSK